MLYYFLGGIVLGMFIILLAYILTRKQEIKMYDPVVISLLEKNVRDLQEQLRNAYVKIKQLNDENYKLRRELGVKEDSGKKITNSSDGVWLGDAQMPDAEHLKDG